MVSRKSTKTGYPTPNEHAHVHVPSTHMKQLMKKKGGHTFEKKKRARAVYGGLKGRKGKGK